MTALLMMTDAIFSSPGPVFRNLQFDAVVFQDIFFNIEIFHRAQVSKFKPARLWKRRWRSLRRAE